MAAGRQPRIYLAGPEVFLPDAFAIGAAKVALCAEIGLTGVFPLDQSLDLSGFAPEAQARAIAFANEDLMRSTNALIANLTPFRGVSADVGTAYEVGFMRALGRPVFGYASSGEDYHARVAAFRSTTPAWRDGDRADYSVENFGLAENLMIEVALREAGQPPVRGSASGLGIDDLGPFEACLKAAAAALLTS